MIVRRDDYIILILIGFLTLTTLVQIFSFERSFSIPESSDSVATSSNGIPDNILEPDGIDEKSNQTENKSMKPLAEILELAGVEVDDELRQSLPPVEGVVEMYGSEPVIIGTDRCEAFQNSIIKGEGFLGPAGMFNTVC
jgi:hypothetical protein